MNDYALPVLGIVLILIMGICLITVFYVAQTKLIRTESFLDRCKWVTDTAGIWGNSGLLGKMQRLGIIYSAILFPQFLSKKNLIDIKQVLSLPRDLKLWIYIPFTTMNTALILAAILYAIEECLTPLQQLT